MQPQFGPPPAQRFDVTPTREEVEFYKENGFLVVQRLTTDEEIEWLRKIFEHVFSPEQANAAGAPVDRSGTLKPGERNLLQQSFFPEMQYPDLLKTNHHRNARRYASALLGVEEERLSCWGHMIKKPPGGRPALWHQDHAYWQPELDYYALGVWLPMHDVSVEMGAMQFIPGSHKHGLLPHHHADAPVHNVLEVDKEYLDASKAVACPLKAGGATFHSSETLHHTAPNTTSQDRLAFPMEFQITPVRRPTPCKMPWVDQTRAARPPGPLNYVANGKLILV
jgi:ectoine hydroxylase-related dioxygenase (phytanoyl-CoA dioxygenase family)